MNDVKVRDYCHINRKYKSSVHKDCTFNLELHEKIPAVFHNLKKCKAHLIRKNKTNPIAK